MRVLLDTCVLSELRKPTCPPQVRQALATQQDTDLFVSVVTIGEITKGIALLDDSQRKRDLRSWLNTLETHYHDRILPIDLETVRIWGEFTAKAQRLGRIVAVNDGLIAATALRHGLTVMTRNTSDFIATGALLFNPWEDA
ncbi:MAG: type II toxin-antitoxin system VapC family toxin [Thiothrix sp.]|nr:MAG: type II toxin-antitoxin system VapC family toxin [Thiothrix sp.]